MGSMLSEPIVRKEHESGENSNLYYSASSMQGWRITMEDALVAVTDVEGRPDVSFFGVFDGHGGTKSSKYAAQRLFETLKVQEDFGNDWAAALRSSFLQLDSDMLKDPVVDDSSGSTSVTTLLVGNKVFCANAGDSRAVMCVKGQCVPLSYDHKPQNKDERDRIIKANGSVNYGRVNGNLALSRAFGDFAYKANTGLSQTEQMVIALPDIICEDITNDTEFIFLACDGIWDVKSNAQVVGFIRERLAEEMPTEQILDELLDSCMAKDCANGGLGCDNMTAILVCLKHGGTMADVYQRAAIHYESSDSAPENFGPPTQATPHAALEDELSSDSDSV